LATTLTVEERTLEKLNPPTAVAGLAAELAYVTRYYEEDYDTGVRTEYGTPRVEVIWGVTVADKLAAVDAEKAAVAEKAAAEDARLDAETAALNKSAEADAEGEVRI
jgi:hypothetical protein